VEKTVTVNTVKGETFKEAAWRAAVAIAVGAVVGATNPQEARELRQRFKTEFFLVPGYGAQGGKGADAAAAFDEKGGGAIVNNSRGLIAAHMTEKYKGMTYAAAAAAAACDMRDDLNKALKNR
ncbi:MAG: hypothetical protein K2M48_01135, partial [Clostridiales bacterium]|nr:hypothetical protein [Clostridiales bacterium]